MTPYFKFAGTVLMAILFFIILVGCLTGCGFREDNNPVPYIPEARAMCEPHGGLERLQVRKMWSVHDPEASLHIFVVCKNGTDMTRNRKEERQ